MNTTFFFHVYTSRRASVFINQNTGRAHTHTAAGRDGYMCVYLYFICTYTHSLTMRIGYIGAYLREHTGNLMPPTRERKKRSESLCVCMSMAVLMHAVIIP